MTTDPNTKLFMYGIIGFCVGIFFFIMGFVWLRRKRLIENTPTSKIRSVAMGLVEIYGEIEAVPDKVYKTPFTDKDCVYYSYSVQEYRGGKNAHWETLESKEVRDLFYLKDETGRVLINPAKAAIEITTTTTIESGMGKDPPENIMAFLNKEGIKHDGWFGINKKMRFVEYYMSPKDKLYILGTAAENTNTGYKSLSGTKDSTVIEKGQDEKYFLISEKSEKQILKSLKIWSIAGIYGGAALSLACLAIILAYIGLF